MTTATVNPDVQLPHSAAIDAFTSLLESDPAKDIRARIKELEAQRDKACKKLTVPHAVTDMASYYNRKIMTEQATIAKAEADRDLQVRSLAASYVFKPLGKPLRVVARVDYTTFADVAGLDTESQRIYARASLEPLKLRLTQKGYKTKCVEKQNENTHTMQLWADAYPHVVDVLKYHPRDKSVEMKATSLIEGVSGKVLAALEAKGVFG